MSSVLARSSWPAGTFTGTTRTESFTLPAGAGRRIAVISAGYATTNGLTFNGATCTPLGASVPLGTVNFRAFEYVVPDELDAGNYDLVFSFSGGDGHTYRAWCINGVSGESTQQGDYNAAGASSQSVATMPGDLLLLMGAVLNPSGTGVTTFSSAQVATVDSTGDSSLSGFRTISADAVGDGSEVVAWELVPNPSTEPSAVFLVLVADSAAPPGVSPAATLAHLLNN